MQVRRLIFSAVREGFQSERRSIAAIFPTETASLVLTGCVLMLSFGSVALRAFLFGRILAVLVTLLCARYGGVAGGSVCGIATGAIFSIASRNKALSAADTHLADLWQDCFRLSANLPA